MKVSIHKTDGKVYVDGVGLEVDTSDLPTYVKVVQWDSDLGKGHIEFVQDNSGKFVLNQSISDFSQFQHAVDGWNIKNEEMVKAQEALEAQQKEDQQKALKKGIKL